MPHAPDEKKRSLNRVRRVRGQCDALERAIEAGTRCGEVLQQIAAIRGAINGLMAEVMESHLREQFVADPASTETAARLQETIGLVRRYLK